jgi:hypothetical protein
VNVGKGRERAREGAQNVREEGERWDKEAMKDEEDGR